MTVSVPEPLLPSHPLHDLLERCQKSDAKLFYLSNILRDKSPPADIINVPSSCWVLDSQNWANILTSDSFSASILMRNEYREATRAVVSFSRKASSRFLTSTENAGDESTSDDILQIPIENPFLELPIGEVSTRAGFILLGHPGIGE